MEKSSSYTKSSYSGEDTISIIDIILIIARRFNTINSLSVIFCLSAILYVFLIADPVYSSISKVISSSSGGSGSEALNLAQRFGFNLPTSQYETKWVYPEIIKSRTLARSVLKQKYDTKEFGSQKSLTQILTYGNDEPEFGFDTLEQIAVDLFLDIIFTNEDKNTGIITIITDASEPKLASDINNNLIRELQNHQLKYNQSKSSDAKKFIEERIFSVEKELMAAEEDLKVFSDRNRRIENSPALQLERQRLGREVTVLTGVFTTLKQQLETTKIEEVKESDYVIVLDHPEVPLSSSKPKKFRTILIAMTFGAILGIIIAFLKEFVENSNKQTRNKINEVKTLANKIFLGYNVNKS